ncbi:hypothetical protein PsorP6_017109 [Peronosclerospora sorghi]|uniref:Uncharacterized protein n=1 Tax=Peronosclerospora sorghi TaxID=230839 RepID=A0ACC0WF65_9STRA|nr:hypothetical protein PsorP6_017109 [Peronosclerospora sorghi]
MGQRTIYDGHVVVSRNWQSFQDVSNTFYRSTYYGITGLAYEALAASTGETMLSLYNELVRRGTTTDALGMLLCDTMQPMLETRGTEFTRHSG